MGSVAKAAVATAGVLLVLATVPALLLLVAEDLGAPAAPAAPPHVIPAARDRFLWIVTTSGEQPLADFVWGAIADHIPSVDLVCVAYRVRAQGCLFNDGAEHPTTHAGNRNFAVAHAPAGPYLYYVFVDDDALLRSLPPGMPFARFKDPFCGSSAAADRGADAFPCLQTHYMDGVRRFTQLLQQWEPAVGVPRYRLDFDRPNPEVNVGAWFDAMVMAVHHQALHTLLPYETRFDNSSIWLAQVDFEYRALATYGDRVLEFSCVLARNPLHREYTRGKSNGEFYRLQRAVREGALERTPPCRRPCMPPFYQTIVDLPEGNLKRRRSSDYAQSPCDEAACPQDWQVPAMDDFNVQLITRLRDYAIGVRDTWDQGSRS